jgi:hypothetical protein
MVLRAKPATRDALQSLIAHPNYWDSRDPEFEKRQRMVRQGFERLYPSHTLAKVGGPEAHEQDRRTQVLWLKQRWEDVFEEYGELLKSYSYPLPESIEERKRELEAEREQLEEELEKYGEPLPHQSTP